MCDSETVALYLGPFWENEDYIVVADRNQQGVYQLKPESGEVRALPVSPCHPAAVAFDPSVSVLYIICSENSRYYIQRKTFDGRIDEEFYKVPQGIIPLQRNILFMFWLVEIITF